MTLEQRSNMLQQLYHLQGGALALKCACAEAQALHIALSADKILSEINEKIDEFTGREDSTIKKQEFPRPKF